VTQLNFSDAGLASSMILQIVQPILFPLNEQIQMMIDKKANDEAGFQPFTSSDI
jgi:hypothetical protein